MNSLSWLSSRTGLLWLQNRLSHSLCTIGVVFTWKQFFFFIVCPVPGRVPCLLVDCTVRQQNRFPVTCPGKSWRKSYRHVKDEHGWEQPEWICQGHGIPDQNDELSVMRWLAQQIRKEWCMLLTLTRARSLTVSQSSLATIFWICELNGCTTISRENWQSLWAQSDPAFVCVVEQCPFVMVKTYHVPGGR